MKQKNPSIEKGFTFGKTHCNNNKFKYCKLKKLSDAFIKPSNFHLLSYPPLFECVNKNCGKHYVLDAHSETLKEADI